MKRISDSRVLYNRYVLKERFWKQKGKKNSKNEAPDFKTDSAMYQFVSKYIFSSKQWQNREYKRHFLYYSITLSEAFGEAPRAGLHKTYTSSIMFPWVLC